MMISNKDTRYSEILTKILGKKIRKETLEILKISAITEDT